jgi:hypothetical protein
MRVRRSSLLAPLCAVALTSVVPGCSDDGTGPTSPLVGTWNATSFTALGQNLIAQGMTLTLTLTAAGTYTLVVTGDVVDICDPGPNCTLTGTYTSTATTITTDPGTADAQTFAYTIQGTTLTFTGSLSGVPATIIFTKA